jgi:hypothetical protein
MSMMERIKRYPAKYPNWKRHKEASPKWLCKERANWLCEQCGVSHRSILMNSEGLPYMCYLSAAHVHKLDSIQPEPIQGQRLRAMCPGCHGAYDYFWRERQVELAHQLRLHKILRTRFFERRFMEVV